MNIITLTTDFGNKDWFTGSLKGIILTNAPEANIVDISHDLESFNIEQAAFFVKNFYYTFPKGTIHCIIVDPTVGSSRKILGIETENYYFIAPDNGILTYILKEEKPLNIVEIKVPKDSSTTFHGRDVFAPAAAKLSNSKNLMQLGNTSTTEPVKFNIDDSVISDNHLEAKVIFIDKFGNIILNINNALWKKFCDNYSNDFFNLHIGSKKYILKYVDTYYKSKQDDILLILGSCGYTEIAINLKNAANILKVKNNNKIIIEKTGNR